MGGEGALAECFSFSLSSSVVVRMVVIECCCYLINIIVDSPGARTLIFLAKFFQIFFFAKKIGGARIGTFVVVTSLDRRMRFYSSSKIFFSKKIGGP